MADLLNGRTALVTGAARRIGRAIAAALAREGADVVVHCNRSRDEAESLAREIRALGRNAWVVPCDIADLEKAKQLFPQARRVAGREIDILVNNASIFREGRPCLVTPEEFNLNMNIHAVTPLILSQHMAAQRCGGDIINMLDTRMRECDNEHAAYHLSKRSLFVLTRMLAMELAPEIRVNAVAPGLVLPPPGKEDSYLEERAHCLPLKRHGSVRDVSDAVLYLLQSPFVTGQVIYLDGGKHLRGNSYEP